MAKTKELNSTFILEEKNGVVIASVENKHDYSFQHTVNRMPNPRVRLPRQSKDEIERWVYFEVSGCFYNSRRECLEKNIEITNQQINKHIHEIRKSLKRMQALKHYVIIAKELLSEL